MSDHEDKLKVEGIMDREDDNFMIPDMQDEDSDEDPGASEGDWDGTESEFVEDDDAEEYEEKYSGIKLNYSLKREEILSCLKHVGYYRLGGARQIVELCVLGILTVMFAVMFTMTHAQVNLVLGGLTILAMLVVTVVPIISLNMNAEKMTTGKQLDVQIYPDNIEVRSGGSKWEIPLDGSSQFEEYGKLFLVYVPQDKIFIIPIRAIEPDFLADVQAMIVAGTIPKSDE